MQFTIKMRVDKADKAGMLSVIMWIKDNALSVLRNAGANVNNEVNATFVIEGYDDMVTFIQSLETEFGSDLATWNMSMRKEP